MKYERQMRATLRPRAVDRLAIRRDRARECRVHRRNIELERRAGLFQRARLNSVNALIETVDRRDRDAVFGHADVQHEMQNVVAGLQRSRPSAGERLSVSWLRRLWLSGSR